VIKKKTKCDTKFLRICKRILFNFLKTNLNFKGANFCTSSPGKVFKKADLN
jgi:hypothetical protein